MLITDFENTPPYPAGGAIMRIWRLLGSPWEIGVPIGPKDAPWCGGRGCFGFGPGRDRPAHIKLETGFQSARWDHAGGATRVFGAIVAAPGS